MTDVVEPLARIDAVLTRSERAIARAFYDAIEKLKNDIDLRELADLLETGQIDAAVQRLQVAADLTGQAINLSFINSGTASGIFLQNAGLVVVGFDQVNQRAVNAMAANSLRFVQDFSESQRAVARTVMTEGIRTGAGPIEQARAFRSVVGLDEQRAGWVASYRSTLEQVGNPNVSPSQQAASLERELRDRRSDRTVERFIRENRPLPAAKIDEMVDRYAARAVADRANTIARTEALRSVHAGSREMYLQAIERGDLVAAQLIREWNTHMDGRERLSHATMNHQRRGWDEPFLSLSGPIMQPGDPAAPARETVRCRCIVTVRIKPRKR